MADSDSDGEINFLKPTPKRIFNRITRIKKVEIVRGETFRNAIVESLEELLNVSKQDLSSEKLKKFDAEVEEFHSYVPRCLKATIRNRKRMLKRFKKYFDRLIVLPDNSVSTVGGGAVDEVRSFFN